MTRPLVLAALAFLLAAPLRAQESNRREALVGEAPRSTEQAPAARLFEIRGGRLWLDGRALPPSAIPDGLDLSGVMMQVELVGAVTPVVEVDGVPYVLDGERLVPFAASSKTGTPLYIMGQTAVSPSAASADRLEPVVEEAYRRQLSAADQALYAKMQQESQLEAEIVALARQARGLPPGPEYDALTADLRARLRALFDLKHEIRREELDRADSELRSLRAVLAERESMRAQIIEHRFHELMGDSAVDR